MDFPAWVDKIAKDVSQELIDQLLGKEFLLYREDFGGPTLAPSVDYFVKGPLQLGDSGNIGSTLTVTPTLATGPKPLNGLGLSIDGTQLGDPVSLSLSIASFPRYLQLLRVVGEFRTIPSPSLSGGPWAASVLVCETGGADGTDSTRRISATMRVNGGAARLGTPDSTLQPQPVAAPDRLVTLFPSGGTAGVDFRIELLLDLAGGNYLAFLDTPAGRDMRTHDHGSLPGLWSNLGVGLGLARVATSGLATVEVRSFQVSGILVPGFWTSQMAGLIRAARRAALPRFVPPNPLR